MSHRPEGGFRRLKTGTVGARMTVTLEYRQGPWDLSELLEEPSEAVLTRTLDELEVEVAALEARRDELSDQIPAAVFLDIVRQYETLVERTLVPASYASLWFSADTQSQEALTFRNRVQQALTGFQNRVLFLSLWWKGLDDEAAERLMPAAYEEPDLRHFLEDLRRVEPYTLEESSEQIINTKDADGIGAVLTIYSMLTNRLEFELEIDGEVRQLTRDELMSHVYTADADLRERAYKELYRVFEGDTNILAQIYVNRCARLGGRERRPARLFVADRGAQRRQRHSLRSGRDAARGLPGEGAAVPALLPAQGPLAGHGAPAALRHLRPDRALVPQRSLR